MHGSGSASAGPQAMSDPPGQSPATDCDLVSGDAAADFAGGGEAALPQTVQQDGLACARPTGDHEEAIGGVQAVHP